MAPAATARCPGRAWRPASSPTWPDITCPGAHGFLESDIAADGLHTGLYWALGRDLYYVGTYHGAKPAISLAIAMTGYPG